MRVSLFLLAIVYAQAALLSITDIQKKIDDAYMDEQHAIERNYLFFVNDEVVDVLERDIKANKGITCMGEKWFDTFKNDLRIDAFCVWWAEHFKGVTCTWDGKHLCFMYSKDHTP